MQGDAGYTDYTAYIQACIHDSIRGLHAPSVDSSDAGGDSRVCGLLSSPQHSGSRIHRSSPGGILIRRSSEESFRLCDDFVTERLVSINLTDVPNTKASSPLPSLSNIPVVELCRNRPLASACHDGIEMGGGGSCCRIWQKAPPPTKKNKTIVRPNIDRSVCQEPHTLTLILVDPCRVRRRSAWTMIHPRFNPCRDPKILNAVHRFMEHRAIGNRGGGGSNATSP